MHPFAPFVDGYWDVENQLAEHIKHRAIKAAKAEAEEKAHLESVGEFERRRTRIKRVFLAALGGLPATDTPLNPKTVGVIKQKDYSIEKVIFESLPRFLVTANLYLPSTKAPAPAILFLCGHAREAKAYPVYQKVCQALAKAGFVVLAVDPLGQGERMSYVNPKSGKLDVEWGVYEHSHAGLQCALAGFNIARFFIHDAMRSIDYLCSRPEVDQDRIGVTGNSGGGTQTSYLMMADARIKAAIPCTFITAREHYLLTGQAHDAEQNLYGAFLEGLNYDDLLTAIAPKPVQLGAVASDFFTIEGTLQSADRARKVYQLYGKVENFRLVVASGTHEYAALLREETVRWFQRHLQGIVTSDLHDVIAAQPWEYPGGPGLDVPPIPTNQSFDILPEEQLWCTPSGQFSLDYPESLTVFDLNQAEWKARSSTMLPKDSTKELQSKVYENREPAPIWARCIDSGNDRDLTWKKVFFFSEPDIAVTGIWITADPDASPWVVLLQEGTHSIQKRPDHVKGLAREKGQVFLFDVRGIGAVQQRPINRYRFNATYGTEFTLNYNAMMLKDSLLWMRAFDVTRALTYVEGATGKTPSLYAEGWLGVVALIAAAVKKDSRVSSLEFDRLLYDISATIDERFHRRDHRLEAFELAMLVDVPKLLGCFEGRLRVKSWEDARGRLLESPPSTTGDI